MDGYDVLWAMATLGFENYIEPLKIYLQKYREVRAYSFGCSDRLSKLVPCLGDFNATLSLRLDGILVLMSHQF
jgi:hypothetical protein